MKKDRLFTRNFSLLILGQASSLIGNYTLQFALSMYLLDISGSAAVFASILSVAVIPTILLSPIGGVLADRVNRRNIMVTLDFCSGTLVLVCTLLLTALNNVAVIAVMLVGLSVLGAFESPTVQASVPQMHKGDRLVMANAVVNQIGEVASLTAPLLGSVLYITLGIRRVLFICVVCFFLTAFFELFLKLEHTPATGKTPILKIIVGDLCEGIRYICREQPTILRIMLLGAGINFFITGLSIVGFPFIVRTVLGLGTGYYGVAESAVGLSALAAGCSIGLFLGRLPIRRLYLFPAGIGVTILLLGLAFWRLPSVIGRYLVTVTVFCALAALVCIYSIFSRSIIQQRTPQGLTGKVMSFSATISRCTQPVSQMFFGLLLDNAAVHIISIPAGVLLVSVGLSQKRLFTAIEKENNLRKETVCG